MLKHLTGIFKAKVQSPALQIFKASPRLTVEAFHSAILAMQRRVERWLWSTKPPLPWAVLFPTLKLEAHLSWV